MHFLSMKFKLKSCFDRLNGNSYIQYVMSALGLIIKYCKKKKVIFKQSENVFNWPCYIAYFLFVS